MNQDVLTLRKLPGNTLPTIAAGDPFTYFYQKANGEYWLADADKALQLPAGRSIAAHVITDVLSATLSDTQLTASVGSEITSITNNATVKIRLGSSISANTTYTFRLYNGSSYLASGTIYWNTSTSYSATAHRAYYGMSTMGTVLELAYNGTNWFVVGFNESEAYPIGSVYMSANSTSPASIFGGSWTQITGRVLVGAGTSDAIYTPGTTGGASDHRHKYKIGVRYYYGTHGGEGEDYPGAYDYVTESYKSVTEGIGPKSILINSNTTNSQKTISTGGAGSEARTSLANDVTGGTSMPPYYVVYMWRRTA